MSKIHKTVYRKISVLSVPGLVSLFIMVVIPGVASAGSQSFYSLNNQAQQGMLVSLSANPGVVQPASEPNAKLLVGIVAPPDETALDRQPGQISVRTDGVANGLVSTLGGDISTGDKIAASSLMGVGTKLAGNGWVVGTAEANLNASSKDVVKATVADSHGVKHSVYVGNIPVLVKIYYFNQSSAAAQSKLLPSSLQTLVDTLAGKHASTLAVILSFLLLISGFIIAGIVVNSAIRGGMSAISRQPLARFVIQGKILQSLIVALTILAVMSGAAFVLLRVL